MKSEIRKDYIEDKYVIIAPKRSKRPKEVAEAVQPKVKKGRCVFCPGNIRSSEIIQTYGQKPWDFVVLDNVFPAVSLDYKKAYGKQEVVVETREPKKQLHQFSVTKIKELLDVYADRTKKIQQYKKIEYILIFKNAGNKAGASIGHAHSQIFATQLIPPHLKEKQKRLYGYYRWHSSCLYCEILEKERKGPRLVYEDESVVAFTPYASMHTYEVWILPKAHRDNIAELTDQEKKSWAKAMKMILTKIDKLGLPYNYYFHQIIPDKTQHLYMKIIPRKGTWAGVELGTGLMINPVSPEDAAEYYRG
ncbi:DUF4931 domain-containing protein [Patescibacteria group bacterium]